MPNARDISDGRRGAISDDGPFVHQDNAIRELFGFLKVVSYENNRAPLGGLVAHCDAPWV